MECESMRCIKIGGGGRYKKTWEGGKKGEKETMSARTKDKNHKKGSVKNGRREEIRRKEMSVPVVSEVPAVF